MILVPPSLFQRRKRENERLEKVILCQIKKDVMKIAMMLKDDPNQSSLKVTQNLYSNLL